MKNSSFRTKKNSPLSSVSRKFGIVLLCTLCGILAVLFLRTLIVDVAGSSVATFMRVRTYFAESGAALPVYIRERSFLESEIQRLSEELAARSGDRSTIGRLTNENEELRSLLGDTADERILAGVIARPPYIPYDTLMIDRGSSQGIVTGAVVYQGGAHAIGVVSRVLETSALVTLFSSAGIESTVYLYGPDVFAYAYGEGGGVIRISVPQGIEVEVGDSVVLPSLHMGDLGVVERVVSIPTQPEQSAYLTFPIPLQSIRTVMVSTVPLERGDLEDLEVNVLEFREQLRVEVPEILRLGTATGTATSTEATGTSTPL
jgi:cell shape-determining protein MreC